MVFLRPLVGVSALDLNQLEMGTVNGTVVKAFFRLIDRRSVFYPTLLKTWSMDPRMLVRWDRDPTNIPHQYARGRGLLEKDLIFFPVAQPSWTLLAARPQRKEIVAFDPFATPRAVEMGKVLDFLEAVSTMEGKPFSRGEWKTAETPEGCPRAPDESAAAVFICAFGDKLSRDAGLPGLVIGAREAGQTILRVLLSGRFEREDFAQLSVTCGTPAESPAPSCASASCATKPSTDDLGLSDMELDEEINARMATVNLAGPTPSTSMDVTGFVPKVAGATMRDPLGLNAPSTSCLELDCSDVEDVRMSPPVLPPIDEGQDRERRDQATARRSGVQPPVPVVELQPPHRAVDVQQPTRAVNEQPPHRAVRQLEPRRDADQRRFGATDRRSRRREPERRDRRDHPRQLAPPRRNDQPHRRDHQRPARGDRRRDQRPDERRRDQRPARDERRRDDRRRRSPERAPQPQPRPTQRDYQPIRLVRQLGAPAAAARAEVEVGENRPNEERINFRVEVPNQPGTSRQGDEPDRNITAFIPGELLAIPDRMVRRIAATYNRMTTEQRKNKRWRIFVGENEYVRVRPVQILRLLELRRQQAAARRRNNRRRPHHQQR